MGIWEQRQVTLGKHRDGQHRVSGALCAGRKQRAHVGHSSAPSTILIPIPGGSTGTKMQIPCSLFNSTPSVPSDLITFAPTQIVLQQSAEIGREGRFT